MITLTSIDTALIGAVLVFLAMIMSFSSFKFISKSKPTTGKIIRLNSTNNTEGSSRELYAPVVEYTVDGERFVHESPRYSNEYTNSIGHEIAVHYLPQNPSSAYIGKKLKFFYFELIVLAIGLSTLFVGLYDLFL